MPASAAWNNSAQAIALAHYAARGEMPPASHQRHAWALEAAQGARQDEQAQKVLHEAQEHAWAARLLVVRSIPHNLSLPHVDTARPWHGIGRRKRRCRAFQAIGHVYLLHQRFQSAPAATVPAHSALPPPVPILLLDVSLSTCPPTPDGLREAIFNTAGLLSVANRPGTYGFNTPDNIPSQPPTPPLAHPQPTHPGSFHSGEWVVSGKDVNPDFAYIIALGRHARAPAKDVARETGTQEFPVLRAKIPAYSRVQAGSGSAGMTKIGQIPGGIPGESRH
ncbi:hypothetical protein BDV93DRAFT_565288 [Ceratobasidium sp. AG-I]|nr:hypothetical protein BDV93DRAFT_565288 [Ceratobasidium sp. AG-I]